MGAYEYQGVLGDANGDGAATDADYTIWADNYGTGATAAVLTKQAMAFAFTAAASEQTFADTRPGDYALPDDAIVSTDRPAEELDLLAILSVPELA